MMASWVLLVKVRYPFFLIVLHLQTHWHWMFWGKWPVWKLSKSLFCNLWMKTAAVVTWVRKAIIRPISFSSLRASLAHELGKKNPSRIYWSSSGTRWRHLHIHYISIIYIIYFIYKFCIYYIFLHIYIRYIYIYFIYKYQVNAFTYIYNIDYILYKFCIYKICQKLNY